MSLVTLTTFVVSLLLAVSQACLHGWGSAYILTLLVFAGVSLLAFIASEWGYAAPMVHRLRCRSRRGTDAARRVCLGADVAVHRTSLRAHREPLAHHCGLDFQAYVLSLFVGLTPWSSPGVLVGLLMLCSLTRGFIQSPIMTITMATLPDHQVRLGAGLRGLLNSLGGTFGIAFAGILLQTRAPGRGSART